MNHEASHSEHPAHEGDRPHFPESEWKQFQRDDVAAGGAIVVLMSAIFSIGLVLYLIIAIVTGTTPNW